MSNAGAKLRAVAAEVIDTVVASGRSLDNAIEANEQKIRPDDRALLRFLCYGTLRHHWQLQSWIDRLLSKPFRKRDSVVNALLAIGLYQLTDSRVPEHAAVSLTVEATRQLRRPKMAGLINACLRRFAREAMADSAPADDVTRWNHPRWLIDRVQNDWPDDWQSILEANMARAPMWLRVDARQRKVAEYASSVGGETLPGLPDAVRLATPLSVDELPGFGTGEVSVQDGAAQIAADWLLNGDGGRILDACAAPGGKTGHLLERGAEVVAVDSDEKRNARVAANLDRLRRSATILTGDASKPEEWWNGALFDGILFDAPCSATGVIRRHPDIKLLRRESDIETLARLQAAILKALWPLLRPGGRLLYVTCSVIAAENDDVLGAFQTTHGDAIEDDVLPNNNIRDVMRRKACGYQILPGTADLDGFYYACLKKKVS